MPAGKRPVAIIMGSKSDWATMRHAADTLKALGVDRLAFKPTTERRRLPPKRKDQHKVMLENEKRRLAELAAAKEAAVGAAGVATPITVA